MKHLDLFSGIGGFALAARWAGIETIAFAETDEYCSAILRKHWPGVPNFGDVRNVRGVRADLVTGGFPCQPFSLAGKRGGAGDDRFLWPEMLAVIADTKPAFVLAENVPGIIHMELDRVLSDMEGIGYTAWPLVIPACAVDARHRRDRVWIVAHAERERGERWRAGWKHAPGAGSCDAVERPSERPVNVADPEHIRAGRRKQLTKRGKGSRDVANPEHDGFSNSQGNASEPGSDRKENGLPVGDGRHTLPDARHGCSEGPGPELSGQQEPSRWEPECGLGRVVARLPHWLDGPTRWPDEDPEIPRVKTGVKNRVQRLKALGNSIVPAVAFNLMTAILHDK